VIHHQEYEQHPIRSSQPCAIAAAVVAAASSSCKTAVQVAAAIREIIIIK